MKIKAFINKIIMSELTKKASLIKEEVDVTTLDWDPLFLAINKAMGINVKMEIVHGGRKPQIKCPNLVSKAGIFKSVVGKVAPYIFSFGQTERGIWLTVSLGYEAIDGGSNGMTMLTAWNEDGKWKIELAGRR